MSKNSPQPGQIAINSNTIFTALAVLTAVMIPFSVLRIMLWTPIEAQLGVVQKIFYFHVPSAMMMYAGFGIAFLASIWYLFGAKDEAAKARADRWAAAGAEVGQVFATLVLVSGPLWARNSWGSFWDWTDPQLMAVLLVYLLFWSYLAIRAFATRGERRRTISAVIAILAAPNMAFIHWALTTTHPKILRGNGKIAPSMVVTLMICFATIALLFAVIYWMRLRVEEAQGKLVSLRDKLYAAEDKMATAASGAFALLPLVLLAQVQKVDEFVPVSEAPVSKLPGGTLLVIAYAAMWGIVLLYIVSLGRKQASIQSEMKSIEKQISDLGSKT